MEGGGNNQESSLASTVAVMASALLKHEDAFG
jgi:hypothetical protein